MKVSLTTGVIDFIEASLKNFYSSVKAGVENLLSPSQQAVEDLEKEPSQTSQQAVEELEKEPSQISQQETNGFEKISLKPAPTFQQQIEALVVIPITRELCMLAARKFIPCHRTEYPRQKFSLSLSPYCDYSPPNRDRTVQGSMNALLCARLAQPSNNGSFIVWHRMAFVTLTRVLTRVPKIEKEPSSVFFPYSKNRFLSSTSVAPDVWAIITSGHYFSLRARYPDNHACLPNILDINTPPFVARPTLSLYTPNSNAPFAVYQLYNGHLWNATSSILTAITHRSVVSWKTSCFDNTRFSNQKSTIVVRIDHHMVFINFQTSEVTCQLVGNDVVFHPRLPIFWTPASVNFNKKYPSRLWLINPSWTEAKPVAWGQEDLEKRAF